MTPDGQGVRISFELEISGQSSPVRLAIYRDYPIKTDDELQGELPYIALWPDLLQIVIGQPTTCLFRRARAFNVWIRFTVEMPSIDAKIQSLKVILVLFSVSGNLINILTF